MPERPDVPDAGPPFRWDLVTPDHLGSLLEGTAVPNLWFLPELTTCAGKVLARSDGGDLVFVGRSLDSMFDLLGGALAEIRADTQPARAPFSFARPGEQRPGGRWGLRPLTADELGLARSVLSELGLTPGGLARRSRPVCFVDVVHGGNTFTELFELVRDWVTEERAPWAVIRTKLRFVGVTSRTKTSPNTFRWQQHAEWTRELPGGSVINVSLDPFVWSYFGDHQTKLTRSFHPGRWLADSLGPERDEKTRQALAEAAALVTYGRSAEGRTAIARAIDGEPALAESWLRSLVRALNQGRIRSAGRSS